MPTIKELADAEAERAEAENPDDETEADEAETDETDDDDQAETDEAEADGPDEPPSEQMMDRALSQIEQAGDEYVAHVRAIQHETPLGLVECPLCPVPGFVADQPMPDIDPLQRLAVLTVIGDAGQPVAPDHPTLHQCPKCEGWGLMTTGSRRPEFATQPCPMCGGNGYVDQAAEQAMIDARAASGLPADFDQVRPPAPTNSVVPTPTVTQGGHTFPVVLGGSLDQVGRMAGHPLWGQPAELGGL